MVEEQADALTEETSNSILLKLRIENTRTASGTLLFAIACGFIYVGISMIPMPFKTAGVVKLGLIPAITVIALAGATRGPIAGFLTGYIGETLYGILRYDVVVALTLPAAAYGVLGLIVGIASFDFTNGRSLIKLGVLSLIGFTLTVLLTVVLGIFVENYSVLAAIVFLMLPLLTTGAPTLLLLTPLLARTYAVFSRQFNERPVKNEDGGQTST